MKKILVTGSTGLIGRQVVKDLAKENFDVFSCYNLQKPELGIPIKLDLTNKEEIKNSFNHVEPDIIIHLGAITNVDMCEINKKQATLINSRSTEILAKESRKNNPFFLYVSTDYVFDGKKGLKKESDIPNPINVYGKTKLDGEFAVQKFTSSYSIVRTSTPFGLHPTKKSFPIWIKEQLELGKELSVIDEQYTSPTFVPNLSKMIVEVIKKRIFGIIHLAGATRISRYEFAKMVAEKFNLKESLLKPTKMQQMNWNAKRPLDSSLNVTKALEILEHKPEKLDKALELFVKQIKYEIN